MWVSRRLRPVEMYPAGEPGVRTRFVALRSGLRVRVVEAGDAGAPAIVLVPGWGCGAWIFHENLREIANSGFHVIAVELKGHGLSDKPREPSEYTADSMRDHLLEILDSLGLSKAALVGHSMGAAIVASVAALAPDRVSGVVLVVPVGFAGVRGMTLFRAITPRFAIPLLPLLATRALVRLMLSVAYGSRRRASPRDVDEFWAPTQFPDFTRALRHLLHEFEWAALFPRMEVPWMTVVGTDDSLSPASDVARYAGASGREPAIVIEGAGHVMFDETPAIVNRSIADFFGTDARSGYISTQNE